MNNINKFAIAFKNITIPNPYDGGSSSIIIRSTLEPHNHEQYIVENTYKDKITSEDGATKVEVGVRYLLRDPRTGAMDIVTHRNYGVRLKANVYVDSAKNIKDNTCHFTILEALVREDEYLSWQLMDKVCRLADDCGVNLVIKPTAFTTSDLYKGQKAKVKREAVQRAVEFFDFKKVSGLGLYRRHQQKML